MKYLLIALFLIPQSLAININEIMYNPEGKDNTREYLEIQGTNNLSEYTVGDEKRNNTLTLLKFVNNSNFTLIVEEGSPYLNLNCSIYTSGKMIGNNLNNLDTIYLYKNNQIVDKISYDNPKIEESPCEKNSDPCNISLVIITDLEYYYSNQMINFDTKLTKTNNRIFIYLDNKPIKKQTSIPADKKEIKTIRAESYIFECNKTIKSEKKIMIFPKETKRFIKTMKPHVLYDVQDNKEIYLFCTVLILIVLGKNDLFN
ncbi:hypothetical protein J4436_00830 [Candidatus Woesearchaeota archaeon]|nr:hypothetical protein [Candidatus Woesearchaeota archaeon]